MTQRELMSDQMHSSLDEAITAARSGRRDEAVRMLRQLVAANPFNADAWVWLGGITSDPHEQRSALEHALAIAPSNQRAQQGLAWLRQTQPAVFAASAAEAPATGRTTPMMATGATQPMRTAPDVDHQANIYDAPTQANAAASIGTYNTPAQPQAAPHATIYDASTQAMPATGRAPAEARSFQTDRMQTQARPMATPADTAYTDRMTAVPVPTAVPDDMVEERRSPLANVARWLIMLLYLLGLGAAATLAGISLYFGTEAFEQAANGLLASFGAQLAPGVLTATYWSSIGILAGIAVLDLIIALGFGFHQRWAWWLNLLIATLTLAGAVALLVPDFTFTTAQMGGFSLNNVVVQGIAGLTAFTALFWILSVASRRAFYPRRVVHSYGR